MISVYQRIQEMTNAAPSGIRSKKDLFKEFTHTFGDREIHFTWDMYEDGIRWMMYNSKTLYSITKDDFNEMIRFIGLTVKEFVILVYHECAISPKFFVSEVCRRPNMDGTYDNYTLDIGKFSQLNCFESGFNSILYNPRQSGSTMFLCALYNWIRTFRPYSANILVPSKSKTDYDLFLEKIEAVKGGIPPIFYNPTIFDSFHYQNNSQFINFILINDFEFLNDSEFQYLDIINNIKSKENIGVYPSMIGFSTRVQIVGNSTINKDPSDALKDIIENKYIRFNERYYNDPVAAFRNTRIPAKNNLDPNSSTASTTEILPRDYNKYILEINFDENNILTQEELEMIARVIPAEYYDTEIRRVRPLKNGG